MSEELKKSIEQLYTTFAAYPFRTSMEGCPCCVYDIDKEKIKTKPLRHLNSEDLEKYAFKAITTWGNIDDFKHFLPRIFELLTKSELMVDDFIILGKLDYAKWTTWASNEQQVINDFLLFWWTNITKNKRYSEIGTFFEIYKLIHSIKPLLDRWVINFDDNSFYNLIFFLDYYYDSESFDIIDNVNSDLLIQWLKEKQEIIENGFFHYDNIDKEFAESISNVLNLNLFC